MSFKKGKFYTQISSGIRLVEGWVDAKNGVGLCKDTNGWHGIDLWTGVGYATKICTKKVIMEWSLRALEDYREKPEYVDLLKTFYGLLPEPKDPLRNRYDDEGRELKEEPIINGRVRIIAPDNVAVEIPWGPLGWEGGMTYVF